MSNLDQLCKAASECLFFHWPALMHRKELSLYVKKYYFLLPFSFFLFFGHNCSFGDVSHSVDTIETYLCLLYLPFKLSLEKWGLAESEETNRALLLILSPSTVTWHLHQLLPGVTRLFHSPLFYCLIESPVLALLGTAYGLSLLSFTRKFFTEISFVNFGNLGRKNKKNCE